MKAWVFGGMLVLCGAVAACSSDSDTSGAGGGAGGSGTGGSSGTGEGGTTGSSSPTSSTTTTTTGGTTVSSSVTTASGNPTCSLTEFTGDVTCDTCVLDACCAEAEACANDQANCLAADGSGTIDPNTSLGGPLLACFDANCSVECGGGGTGVCDSGLTSNDPATDQCLTDACCAEANACTGTGADVQACLDCLDAGGTDPLCADFNTCATDSGCFGGGGGGICDSGLTTGDDAVDACLGDACCVEADACTGTGADVQACIDCLDAGATDPLCADFAACIDASGC